MNRNLGMVSSVQLCNIDIKMDNHSMTTQMQQRQQQKWVEPLHKDNNDIRKKGKMCEETRKSRPIKKPIRIKSIERFVRGCALQ